MNVSMKIFSSIVLALLVISCGSSKSVVSDTSVKSTTMEKKVLIVVPSEEVKDSIPLGGRLSDTVKEAEVDLAMEVAPSEETKKIISPEVFNHSVWNDLVTHYVSSDGRVNYDGFRKSKGILRDYIESLGANMPANHWTQEDKLAYWMNAYNAMTVDLILRNLPLESIKDIDKPWNQRLWKLGDKWYNLDEIEHKILRKMDDPRIHFGINCASFSCPTLYDKAFTSAEVNSQLDLLTKRFINDPKRNTITPNSIKISKIFSWFSSDFKTQGTLIDFLNTYSNTTIQSNAKTRYKDYDWRLNN